MLLVNYLLNNKKKDCWGVIVGESNVEFPMSLKSWEVGGENEEVLLGIIIVAFRMGKLMLLICWKVPGEENLVSCFEQ